MLEFWSLQAFFPPRLFLVGAHKNTFVDLKIVKDLRVNPTSFKEHFWSLSCINLHRIILKRATIKVVCITTLFLVNVLPFCVVFAAAAFKTPESTKWLDYTFFFPLFNGMVCPHHLYHHELHLHHVDHHQVQPIVYILSFQRLREASIKIICCGRNRQGLDVFKISHVESKKPFESWLTRTDSMNRISRSKPGAWQNWMMHCGSFNGSTR